MKSAGIEILRTPPLEDIPKHKDLIYDVGMHKGEDTEFYLRKGFRVVAFEADPDLAQLCRKRLKDYIDSGKLIVVEGAVLDEDAIVTKKTVQFFKNEKNSVWGTVSTNWAERNEGLGCPSNTIEINTVDFVATLKKYGMPRYLKIDIEGCDMVCVNALKKFHERPDFVSIESGTNSFASIKREINTFKELGYEFFQIVEQSAITGQTPPNPPREGQYTPQHFEEGCSGLFGLELGDNWQTEHLILRRYRTICFVLHVIGIVNKWKFRGSKRLRAITGKLLARFAKESPWGWYDTHARHRNALI